MLKHSGHRIKLLTVYLSLFIFTFAAPSQTIIYLLINNGADCCNNCCCSEKDDELNNESENTTLFLSDKSCRKCIISEFNLETSQPFDIIINKTTSGGFTQSINDEVYLSYRFNAENYIVSNPVLFCPKIYLSISSLLI